MQSDRKGTKKNIYILRHSVFKKFEEKKNCVAVIKLIFVFTWINICIRILYSDAQFDVHKKKKMGGTENRLVYTMWCYFITVFFFVCVYVCIFFFF